MSLITDSSLCSILGFDLDATLGNIRRYAKTTIKHLRTYIQDALDALGGEALEPLQDITDKIDEEVTNLMNTITEGIDPYTTAANVILNCIGTNIPSFNFSLGTIDWNGMLNDWLLSILDTYLSDSEKLLWGFLSELESALSPYMLDKVMAMAACLIGCPGVVGSSTPGPDGWGVITPQGWVYINQSDFTDLVNTIGLGTDGDVEFDEFGASGATYGSRIRAIQDKKNKVIGALTAVATNTVPPSTESQQVITDYEALVNDVEEAYAEYQGITEDILEYLQLSNEDITEVDLYIGEVYKLGTFSYRTVADSGKTKMESIYGDIETYYSNANANDADALTAYNELDLSTLQTLNTTNGGYKTSARADRNRILSLKRIVRSMARALEDKGVIEASVDVGGAVSRGREAVKPATGTGSYQEAINAI